MSREAVDITHAFWPVVDGIQKLKHGQIKETPEYKYVSDCVVQELRLKIHVDVLGDASMVAFIERTVPRLDGVIFQYPYVYFEDINVVFTSLINVYWQLEHSRADILINAVKEMGLHTDIDSMIDAMASDLSIQ